MAFKTIGTPADFAYHWRAVGRAEQQKSRRDRRNSDSEPAFGDYGRTGPRDGKDGRDCLVAVDGTVYRIKYLSLWQNGEHTTSNGEAYCGADMTRAIDKSPYGRQMLDVLIKVGPLR